MSSPIEQTTKGISEYIGAVPNEVWALVLILGGLICGLIARLIFVRLAERISKAQDSPTKSLEITLRRAGPIALWSCVFVMALLAFQFLDLRSENPLLDKFVQQLPNFLVAAIVILVGHLVGVAVRDFVVRAMSDTRIAVTIGRVSYVSIFVIGIIIGLQQVDVDISFLGNSIIVLLGVVLASIGITIGIGSQHHVANLVARQELANLSVGDRIRIQNHSGTIVEIRRTKVHLMTEEGTTYIPASMFSHEPYVLISSDD